MDYAYAYILVAWRVLWEIEHISQWKDDKSTVLAKLLSGA